MSGAPKALKTDAEEAPGRELEILIAKEPNVDLDSLQFWSSHTRRNAVVSVFGKFRRLDSFLQLLFGDVRRKVNEVNELALWEIVESDSFLQCLRTLPQGQNVLLVSIATDELDQCISSCQGSNGESAPMALFISDLLNVLIRTIRFPAVQVPMLLAIFNSFRRSVLEPVLLDKSSRKSLLDSVLKTCYSMCVLCEDFGRASLTDSLLDSLVVHETDSLAWVVISLAFHTVFGSN